MKSKVVQCILVVDYNVDFNEVSPAFLALLLNTGSGQGLAVADNLQVSTICPILGRRARWNFLVFVPQTIHPFPRCPENLQIFSPH